MSDEQKCGVLPARRQARGNVLEGLRDARRQVVEVKEGRASLERRRDGELEGGHLGMWVLASSSRKYGVQWVLISVGEGVQLEIIGSQPKFFAATGSLAGQWPDSSLRGIAMRTERHSGAALKEKKNTINDAGRRRRNM